MVVYVKHGSDAAPRYVADADGEEEMLTGVFVRLEDMLDVDDTDDVLLDVAV